MRHHLGWGVAALALLSACGEDQRIHAPADIVLLASDWLHFNSLEHTVTELAPGAGSAAAVWQFIAPSENYAPIMSSAYRLSSGNTLVAYGTPAGVLGSSGPIEVYEVEPAGTVVWRLDLSNAAHMYRATPVQTVGGEEPSDWQPELGDS